MKKISVLLCVIIILSCLNSIVYTSAENFKDVSNEAHISNISSVSINRTKMADMVKNEIPLVSLKKNLSMANTSEVFVLNDLKINLQGSEISIAYTINNRTYFQTGELYYDNFDVRYEQKLFADMTQSGSDYSILSIEIFGQSQVDTEELLVNSTNAANGVLVVIEDIKNETFHYVTGLINSTSITAAFSNNNSIEAIPSEKYFEITNLYLKSATYSDDFSKSIVSYDFEGNVEIENTTAKKEPDVSIAANPYDSKIEWIRLINDLKSKSTIYPSSYNVNTMILRPSSTTVGEAQWADKLKDNFGLVRLGYYDATQNKYNIYVSFIELLSQGNQINSSTAEILFEFGYTNSALTMHGFHASYWKSDHRLQYIYNKGLKFKNIKLGIGNVHKDNSKNVIYRVTQEYKIRSYSNGSLYSAMKNNPVLTTVASIAIGYYNKAAGASVSILNSLDFKNPVNTSTKTYPNTYEKQLSELGSSKIIRSAGVNSNSYYIYEKNDFLRVITLVNTPNGSTNWTWDYSYTVYS